MAFTLDANPLSVSMNSYTTVLEANDYFTARFGAEKWATLESSAKEALLVTSTNTLETFTFGGFRTNKLQSLKWPRKNIYNEEGTVYSSDVVISKVKQAQLEMAYWKMTEEDRPGTDAELEQLESSVVGPLNYKFKSGVKLIPSIVSDMLKSIGPGVLLSAPGSKSSTTDIVR